VIAFAVQFAIFGIDGVGIGVWTYKRADDLNQANKAITSRFSPGRVGRAAGAAIDSSAYRIARVFVIGVGVLAFVISLAG
jgi:hypothetical protein